MSLTTQNKTLKDLPSPKGKPILGNLPEFKDNNKHRVFEKWSKECGDLYSINLAGKKFIVSLDPDFNGKVLKARPGQFSRYGKINEVFLELGISGVFNAEGQEWYKHRKVAAEALNAKNVKQFFPIIQSKTSKLLNRIQSESDAIDVQHLFMCFTIDITTEIAFGYELNTIDGKADEFQQNLEMVFPMINKRISSPFPIWRYVKSKKDKALEKGLKQIEQVINQFIDEAEERLKHKSEPSNFLEALLIESESETFTKKEVFGNVFTMLLAGEDTTSNSLSWAIFYLCQHPEWVQKVREEATLYEGSFPSKDADLNSLKIANAIAQEAMRMKPTTPQLFMQAKEDVVINELFIPKDQVVMLQNMKAQNAEEYFMSAYEFRPERWLAEACPYHQKHTPENMRAFGAGPRFCPGMKLATNEMIMAISSICKSYDLELAVDPKDVHEEFAFTMHPTNLKVRFKSIAD